MSDTDRAAVLARARTYPYSFPRRSFAYLDGRTGAFDREMTKGRSPVLAFGSNQSPERLTQKFGHQADHLIPVERARLRDFDVVYSAHITSYGAVPAMLQVSEGASVELAITWLDDRQLEIMHQSEISAANYFYAALDGVALETESAALHRTAYAYVGTRGHLEHDAGGAIALAAVACQARRYRAMTTDQALELVRRRHAAHYEPDSFILEMVRDTGSRRSITEELADAAQPFAHPFRMLRSKDQNRPSPD